jgi:soluble lytic murein transglycosylase-like protein
MLGLGFGAPALAETPLLYQQIAVKHQLSADALYRRALQRSGRLSRYAQAPLPWPWTVRLCVGDHCETVYPESRDAMAAMLEAGRAAGVTFYVGPLGWRWDADSVVPLWAATSPRITLNEAARQWAKEVTETALSGSPPLSPESVAARSRIARWSPLIERVAREEGLNPALIQAMVQTESSHQPDAVSPRGAVGLMQLMPETAERFGLPSDGRRQPEPNLRAGMRYLKWLLNTFDQDLALALAAYNAGEGAVARYGRRIPPYPETENYVRRIAHRLARFSTSPGAPRS